MREEVPKVDVYIRKQAQRTQIKILPERLVGIIGKRLYPCCVVLDAMDLAVRKQAPTKYGKIEPSVIGLFNSAIVEVESIDVNIRFHEGLQ